MGGNSNDQLDGNEATARCPTPQPGFIISLFCSLASPTRSRNSAGSCPFMSYSCLFFTHRDEGVHRLPCAQRAEKQSTTKVYKERFIGRSCRDPGGFYGGSLGRISTELFVLENGSSSIP